MKIQKYLMGALLLMAMLLPTTSNAKGVVTPRMYMFGFAASFNDTIVHFTDIQAVDSVWIDSKTQFMLGRENYSNMLRSYLNQQQMPNRTCIVTTHRPTVLNLCKRVYQVMGQTVTELDEESSARMAMEF